MNFRKFIDSDKARVLELLSHHWSISGIDKVNYFNWKYYENPLNLNNPCAYIAEEGDKIVGFRGWLISEYSSNNIKYTGYALADTVVHPDFRRRGIFKKLTEYSVNHINSISSNNVFLNLSCSLPTIAGYQKIGWDIVCKKSFLTKTKFIDFSKSSNLNNVILTDRLPDEFNDICYTKPTRLRNNKSFTYLQWKISNPSRDYSISYIINNDNVEAYIIVAKESTNTYIVLDYYYNEINTFSKVLRTILNSLDYNKIHFWNFSINAELTKCLLLHGFYPFNKVKSFITGVKTLPFLAYSDSIKINDVKYWNIMPLDSDGY